jgi:hypothetical protein
MLDHAGWSRGRLRRSGVAGSFRKAGVIRSAYVRSFVMTAGAMRYASNIIVPCGSRPRPIVRSAYRVP